MRRQRKRSFRLLALIAGFSLLAAACGDDSDDSDDDVPEEDAAEEEGPELDEEAFVAMLEDVCGTGDEPTPTDDPPEGGGDGEFVDLGTFSQDPPADIDPALNTTLDGAQVIRSLYDPLTEIDYSDPAEPTVVGKVAESWESNDEATVWTFQIREGLKFSNGEDVLPSSFRCAWERASFPVFSGYYAQMFNYIEGGAEKLAGEAETMSGVEADDEAMTLTVTLAEPYADFAATVNHATWMPMPTQAILDLGADQADWDHTMMVGNGPYILESERSDQEIALVPNPEWDGTQYEGLDLPAQPHLDRLVFRVSSDIDTAFNAFEAGEGHNGPIPPGRVTAAMEYPNVRDINQLGTYYFQIGPEGDSAIAGDDNVLLRQAISQAIDRDELNDIVWEGSQPPAGGMVPEGIPGYEAGICDYCDFDPAAAEDAFQAWLDEGNELADPIVITFNTDAGHEDVVDIMVDNLAAVGIDAELNGMPSETYFDELSEGACVDICRVGWFADFPAYDNFLYELFHSDSGNNYGYENAEFDDLVVQARAELDEDLQGELYREAESMLLNEDVGTFPIAHYAGQYVYAENVTMPYNNTGDIAWELVRID